MNWCTPCGQWHPPEDFDAAERTSCRLWREETVEGVEVELDSLTPAQCVGAGDGGTNHRLYTLVDSG